MRSAANLPDVAQITERHVVSGVEPLVDAEIAVREGSESLVNDSQSLSLGKVPRHRGHPTGRLGRMRRWALGLPDLAHDFVA
jgi:hypothetical protein